MSDIEWVLAQYKERHNVKELAAKLEKKYFSLAKQLNPNDRYTLSVYDLVAFTKATQDFALLDHIEMCLDRVAIPVQPTGNADLCSLTGAVGHALSAYSEALADGRISRDEARACETELLSLVRVAMALLHQCHELGK